MLAKAVFPIWGYWVVCLFKLISAGSDILWLQIFWIMCVCVYNHTFSQSICLVVFFIVTLVGRYLIVSDCLSWLLLLVFVMISMSFSKKSMVLFLFHLSLEICLSSSLIFVMLLRLWTLKLKWRSCYLSLLASETARVSRHAAGIKPLRRLPSLFFKYRQTLERCSTLDSQYWRIVLT